MIRTLFGSHPASVGETYLTHLVHAAGFGVTMLVGALACLIHALLPFLFQRTGSEIVRRLHRRMVTHRVKADVTLAEAGEAAAE